MPHRTHRRPVAARAERLMPPRAAQPSRAPVRPDRVRRIDRGFAAIPNRFLHGGFFASLRHTERSLYLFLVLAGDRNGVSSQLLRLRAHLLGPGDHTRGVRRGPQRPHRHGLDRLRRHALPSPVAATAPKAPPSEAARLLRRLRGRRPRDDPRAHPRVSGRALRTSASPVVSATLVAPPAATSPSSYSTGAHGAHDMRRGGRGRDPHDRNDPETGSTRTGFTDQSDLHDPERGSLLLSAGGSLLPSVQA